VAAMANITSLTPEKEAKLLDLLREVPNYAAACRKIRISRETFYRHRRINPAFDRAVIDARNQGLDALEDALITRGIINDTTAAIFMLKSHRREIYGDKVSINLTIEQKAEEIAKRLGVPKETVLEKAQQVAAGAWDTWQPE
jgi:hypothetical protein